MKRILTLLTACLCVLGAHAQEEMLLSADAKSLGMGGVAMTTVSGSHAIFNNPAASIFSRQRMQLSGTYISPQNDNYYLVSGFYNLDSRNLVQAGWRRFGHSGSHHMTFDAGYTRRIGEHWGVGAVLRYQRAYGQDALSADLGFLYTKPLKDFGQYSTLRVGGKLGALGGFFDASDRTLPISLTAGAALDTFITDAHEVTLGIDAGYNFTPKHVRGFQASIGAEYNLMQLVQLRAGYHIGEKGEFSSNFGSVGAGVRFLHLRLDFAYLFAKKTSELRNTWSISFGFDF